MEITKRTYEFTNSFPVQEQYGLVSQMQRSAVSIPSNIAEGCSRDSDKDFVRYLRIALGSSFELETQSRIYAELGFIDREGMELFMDDLGELQKMIRGFIKNKTKN